MSNYIEMPAIPASLTRGEIQSWRISVETDRTPSSDMLALSDKSYESDFIEGDLSKFRIRDGVIISYVAIEVENNHQI